MISRRAEAYGQVRNHCVSVVTAHGRSFGRPQDLRGEDSKNFESTKDNCRDESQRRPLVLRFVVRDKLCKENIQSKPCRASIP